MRGALVLVTNANRSSIREIYEGIGRQRVVGRASVLAASAAHRNLSEELVIQTWLDARRATGDNVSQSSAARARDVEPQPRYGVSRPRRLSKSAPIGARHL